MANSTKIRLTVKFGGFGFNYFWKSKSVKIKELKMLNQQGNFTKS